MKPIKAILSFGLLALIAATRAQATVIVTYAEDPGQLNSTLVNSTTDTFNSITPGFYNSSSHESAATQAALTWAGVGTFTNLDIKTADQYGGAANTNYAVVGLGVNTQSILNLNTPSSYFGLWWSAGDAKNVLDFYSGANGTGTLLAEFTTTNLMDQLKPKTVYPNGYYGNPNAGSNYQKDSGEPFSFINFFGVPGTEWSSIVITNNGSSGFEADNYTSRVAAYDSTTDGAMPGVVLEAISGTQEVLLAQAPEPSAKWAMFLIGGLSLGSPLLRRSRKTA